ncbi:GMC family oxidoreductase [Rhodococcus sp. NPDC055112]
MIYDVVVVGSGFGGAVAACRLAAAGRSVLVLERGRRWEPEDYPRRPGDAWLFDPRAPHRRNGWLELRFLDQMVVAQGAGVGGGSLIYANVCIDAQPEAFASGWPSAITAEEMAPYYRDVAEMLTPMEIPAGQHTARLELMRRAADAIGEGERFQKVPLAIRFDPSFTPAPAETPEYERSVAAPNAHGREQGTCVHCGSCDVGCPTRAKNTLDLNYLAAAEDSGAVIAPLSLARYLSREDEGWQVHFDHLDGGRRRPDSVTARRVILAAGSLGSTELLLRSRDEHRTLADLPRALGRGWSSNGDFLTPAGYGRTSVAPTSGPTITSAIDFLDGARGGRYFVEDGGIPNLLRNCFEQRLRDGVGSPLRRRMWLRLSRASEFDSVMPWFGQSVDAADGSFYLGRGRVRPWRRVVKLDWNPHRSETAIGAMAEMHALLTEATGGKPNPLLTWKRFRALVTPHPLGGCNMAAAPAAGVVDHACRVFGQDGLYVMDGAVIPRAIGRNPSKTIAAVAERAVALLLAED